MTTPIAELLGAVPSLNDPTEPFTYEVRDGTIVGSWDIVRATTLYPTEIESIDKDYHITVTLDAAKHTYEFNERKTSSEGSVSGDGAGFSKDFFSGKSTSKEFSFSIGGVSKTDDGVSMKPVAYTFSTSRIKDPLFTFLQQHGWQRKKGLLSGLFNR
ncbi:MAG: Ca2+/Na+ antiporter [Aeromicrobium sp.]|nr:Ca2+/Na+ antiporter [Aeromicrobium sp.]